MAVYLMVSAVRETKVYYFTPNELTEQLARDSSFYHTGIKVGGRVVAGTIERASDGRSVSFQITDSSNTHTYRVNYHGTIPDTFTDGVDVIVEGRVNRERVFTASTLLAKCASRYEAVPEGKSADAAGKGKLRG
jgi:cytochrome c-type biogenesis protein CcmE